MPPSWHPVPTCTQRLCGRRAILRCRYDCGRRNHSPSRKRRIESDADLIAATTTAGGTILLCCSEEWNRTRTSLPLRPLQAELFSAALIPKFDPEIKNQCTQKGINREKHVSIRKFGPEIKNRCTKEGVNREILASIRKSGLEIKNRCTQKDVSGVNLASILKSGLEIKNHCTQEGQSRAFLAAIPDFSPRISNHCSARSLSLDIPADKWSEAWCRGRGMPDGQGLRTA